MLASCLVSSTEPPIRVGVHPPTLASYELILGRTLGVLASFLCVVRALRIALLTTNVPMPACSTLPEKNSVLGLSKTGIEA